MTKKSVIWLAAVPVTLVLGCGGGDVQSPPGAGGSIGIGGGNGTGGLSQSGGSTAVATRVEDTGGAAATGGAKATGGLPATGGADATGGSNAATGGTRATSTRATGGNQATGGTRASAAGGTRAMGGTRAVGGAATGGAAAGGNTSASGCQKGQVKSGEVVIMGESFYAMSPQYIEKRLESNAQAAGALATSYRNVAESGQPMSYIAGTEWTNATKSTVKVVIMDGGGIDCLTSGSCPTCASQFTTLLGKMATAGVQDVIYTRYPEPGAPPGSDTTLKSCLDSVMPTMQPVCEGATGLRCHWVDLRPVFVAGDTTDGLHPTQTGGNHVGDLIWSEMVKQCIAQ